MLSCCRNGDEILLNEQQGYLLRTKPVGTDEGGVATGYSVLDSPYLVDSWPPVLVQENALAGSDSKSMSIKSKHNNLGQVMSTQSRSVQTEAWPSVAVQVSIQSVSLHSSHGLAVRTVEISKDCPAAQTDSSHSKLSKHSMANQTEKVSKHSLAIQTDSSHSVIARGDTIPLSQSTYAENDVVKSMANQTDKVCIHSQAVQTDSSRGELDNVNSVLNEAISSECLVSEKSGEVPVVFTVSSYSFHSKQNRDVSIRSQENQTNLIPVYSQANQTDYIPVCSQANQTDYVKVRSQAAQTISSG